MLPIILCCDQETNLENLFNPGRSVVQTIHHLRHP